ncbi:hypothetical protein E6O75_ATG03677 [Venturia nashicola]|uniref:Uncharacterized protein n=1 Tax=Venturia nashicola TaxID=86259 RepID=A0A4Z1PSM9_9PEZI|nr:hypothetical protein E6O75_ATG03677 [Venturia nashicola]
MLANKPQRDLSLSHSRMMNAMPRCVTLGLRMITADSNNDRRKNDRSKTATPLLTKRLPTIDDPSIILSQYRHSCQDRLSSTRNAAKDDPCARCPRVTLDARLSPLQYPGTLFMAALAMHLIPPFILCAR